MGVPTLVAGLKNSFVSQRNQWRNKLAKDNKLAERYTANNLYIVLNNQNTYIFIPLNYCKYLFVFLIYFKGPLIYS